MTVFQDLRISSDGKQLFIDASIAPYSYYEGEYISAIAIDTDETYIPSGSSSNPVYKKEFQDQSKQQAMILSPEDLGLASFNGHIFYVYITVEGSPDSQTPCSWDLASTLGVVLNWYPVYYRGLEFMRKTADNCCDVSREFIDYILRFKAFELALRTGNYQLANSRFREWFYTSDEVAFSSPCGCI